MISGQSVLKIHSVSTIISVKLRIKYFTCIFVYESLYGYAFSSVPYIYAHSLGLLLIFKSFDTLEILLGTTTLLLKIIIKKKDYVYDISVGV